MIRAILSLQREIDQLRRANWALIERLDELEVTR